MLRCILMTAAGFLSGSLLFSYFIPLWFFRKDVREDTADGNPGSTNAMRAVGLPVGLICMFLDIAKAFAPVFAAVHLLHITGWHLIPVIAAPGIGHAFSPFLGFRGGKAVSTTYGCLLGLIGISNAVWILAFVMAAFRFIIVIRPDSTMVIVSLGVFYILTFLFEPLWEIKIAAALVSLIVGYKTAARPDEGDQTVSFWRYALSYEDKKFRLHKV